MSLQNQLTENKRMPACVSRYLRLTSETNDNVITWESLTDKKRAVALHKLTLVLWTIDRIKRCYASQNTAIKQLLLAIKTSQAPANVKNSVVELGKIPGKATVAKWIKAYNAAGKLGLVNKTLGQARKLRGWEAKALEIYHIPSRPTMQAVARKLREDLGFGIGENIATDTAVRRFFNTMPSELKDKSSWRMGQKSYRDNQRDYNIRTTTNLPVGFLYQGDGHCLDVYLAHPKTGEPWRAELTPWMDIRSRYIVGYTISDVESAKSTIKSLTNAMRNHDHVPAMLHIDNGSGFKNKLTTDEFAGFYKRMGIEVMWAIPGNAKAKNIERWFRYMEGDFNKLAFPDFFVGEQHSEEAKLYMWRDIKKKTGDKKLALPTQAEWESEFRLWLNKYHNRPHPEDKTTTPAKLWATLKRTPIHDDADLSEINRIQVNVKRQKVSFHGRVYNGDFLYQFNDKKMMVEYDNEQDKTCRLLHLDGRFVMTMHLKEKLPYLSESRTKDAAIKSSKEATKRLEKKITEKQARLAPQAIDMKKLNEIKAIEGEFTEVQEQSQLVKANNKFDALLNESLLDEVTEQNNKYDLLKDEEY